MATHKPIVQIAGILRALPPGDVLDLPQVPGASFEATNAHPNLQRICTPVAIGAQGFQPARANALDLAEAKGLIQVDQSAPNAAGAIQSHGVFEAAAAQWQQATGEQNGLTAGANYYLSSTLPGRLTTTIPTTGFIVYVGKALSTTRLLLDIRPPIGL